MSDTECTYSTNIECLPRAYSSEQGAWGPNLLEAHSLEGETDWAYNHTTDHLVSVLSAVEIKKKDMGHLKHQWWAF